MIARTDSTDRDTEALDYWGVTSADEPIGIVPWPCGRVVCPNHQDNETACDDRPDIWSHVGG